MADNSAMSAESISSIPLVHRPTGRPASIVCAEDLLASKPACIGAKYVLFVASERVDVSAEVAQARSWVDAGAAYMCAWGPASSELDDVFDYAAFLPEVGEPLAFALLTTWHDKEALEDALWFAFYNATAPDDLKDELESVVVLTDSLALAERCAMWIRDNSE